MARPSGSRLFTVYVVASLVPVVVLGFLVNRMVDRESDQRALAEAVARARTIGDGSIEPALDGNDLGNGITDDQRARLFRATAALHGDASVLRLRVRALDGSIVFDASKPGAPVQRDNDESALRAAKGEDVRELTHLGADQIDGGSGTGMRAVETYVPLQAPDSGAIVGVLETYLPYAPFQATATESEHRLTEALVVGLLGIWTVLAAITWSVTKRLRTSAFENDWLARHDPLTRLPNRTAFVEMIDAHWTSGSTPLVAVIDIDRFREVNDTLGQANGDDLLVQVAGVATDRLPPHAKLARLDGDQFGILIPHGRPVDEIELLETLAEIARQPFVVDGVTVLAGLTVGVADSRDVPAGAVRLLRAAELALHEAEEVGVAALHFNPAFDHFDADRLALAAELGEAIANGELVLHYQPKIDLASNQVRSVEALVRWEHPRRGILQPMEFIPIAESTRLIEPLTEWVIEEAARQIARWDLTRPQLTVSVNLSARSLADPGLPDRIVTILAAASVPPARLQLEITETAVLADPRGAQELLQQMHDTGVHVSLDDFGQGATSLVSLATLPLDELKVDRAFVVGMDESEEQRAVVEFVIALGRRLGLTVVAEGIETEDAASMLTAMGCDEGQGYLYCRPVPAVELEHWLDLRVANADPNRVRGPA